MVKRGNKNMKKAIVTLSVMILGASLETHTWEPTWFSNNRPSQEQIKTGLLWGGIITTCLVGMYYVKKWHTSNQKKKRREERRKVVLPAKHAFLTNLSRPRN